MVRVANEYLACACRVQQDNPKKNMSADRYERYKSAKTVGEFLDAGGTSGDLRHDWARGYVTQASAAPGDVSVGSPSGR